MSYPASREIYVKILSSPLEIIPFGDKIEENIVDYYPHLQNGENIMKNLKKILAAAFALCLLLMLIPCAAADNDTAGKDLAAMFEGKTWDDIISDFMERFPGEYKTKIMLGYYNTVTGEEYYLNGDDYTVAASTFKVPLNMLYAEKIAAGEMSLETEIGGYEYSELLRRTIVNSNNELASVLWDNYGGYNVYRHAIAKYAAPDDPDSIGGKFYENNFITARQALTILRTLYENQENFPYIIDTMKEAEPDSYFCSGEKRYEIAHKYGLLRIFEEEKEKESAETEEEDSEDASDDEKKPEPELKHYYVNDTAIVYTDDPIIIVYFSDMVPCAYDMMAAYCTLMCDYTQYQTALRAERAEQAANAAEEESEKALSELTEAAAVEKIEMPGEIKEEKMPDISFGTFVLGVLALAVGLTVLIMVICNHRKVGLFWGFIAAVLITATLLVCLLGSTVGILITGGTEGDPADTVTEFFDALTLGNYTAAYEHLNGYSTLGLENAPEGEAAKLLQKALERSYSYQLNGTAVIDGISAVQDVDFTYLDLNAIDEKVQALTPKKLEELVESSPLSKVYDENNEYLPEITQKAYINALKEVLSDAESCYTGTTFTVSLDYIGKTWLITPDQSLFRALLGGISY